MPAGRPTKYQLTYCDLVIEEMAQGKSLTAFAAEIGVSRETIEEWRRVHPEFSVSVKIAKAKCAAWWEERGRALSQGALGNAGVVVFGLKNMAPEDWVERTETKVDGSLTVVSKEQRDAAFAAALIADT